MTGNIAVIAGNTLRAIFSRHAVYIWGGAVLLMLLQAAPAIFYELNYPSSEIELYRSRAGAISSALGSWSLLCIASAIFTGAATIASEVASKTLITIIARPVRRWEVLVGRWLGVTLFALISLALGLALTMGAARYLQLDIDGKVLGLAIANTALASALLGALAVALSAAGPSTLAAAMTVLLFFLPVLVELLKENANGAPSASVVALDSAIPAGYQSHYPAIVRGVVRPRPLPPIDYPAERAKLAENAAHTAAYLLIGAFFFTRRDIKL